MLHERTLIRPLAFAKPRLRFGGARSATFSHAARGRRGTWEKPARTRYAIALRGQGLVAIIAGSVFHWGYAGSSLLEQRLASPHTGPVPAADCHHNFTAWPPSRWLRPCPGRPASSCWPVSTHLARDTSQPRILTSGMLPCPR